MAQGSSPLFTPKDYFEFRRGFVVLSCALAVIGIIAVGWTLWYVTSTPKIMHVTNNEYKNQSQWQATVVFPNGGIPVEIEHFHHVEHKPSVWLGKSERMKQIATKRITELSARCLWWTSELIAEDGSERHSIITCFKEKVQKKEK